MIYWKCNCGKIYPEDRLLEWSKDELVLTYWSEEGKILFEETKKYKHPNTITFIQCSSCGKTMELLPATIDEVKNAYARGEIDMPTSIDELAPVDMPSFDPTPFIGKKAKIEDVTVEESKNPAITHPHLKIVTGVVTKLGDKDVRATKLLGLYAQAGPDGKPVVGWGKKSKTAAYLESFGVKTPKELIGKEVILQTQMAKDGRKYLTF